MPGKRQAKQIFALQWVIKNINVKKKIDYALDNLKIAYQ